MQHLFYLNKYLIKYKYRLLLGLIFIVFANAFSLVPAQVVRRGFNTIEQALINYKSNDIKIDSIKEELMILGLILILFSLAKGLFTFMMRQTIIVTSRLIEYDLKNEVYNHYQKLSLNFYRNNNTGDLMNRISEDVSRVRMYLGPAIMYSLNLTVLIIIIITAMFSVNVKLSLYVLAPLPILSIAIYYVSRIINLKSEKVQRQLSTLSTFCQESFSGIKVLKSYIKENDFSIDFNNESIIYKDKMLDLVKVNAFFFPLMILLIGLSTILTIYIGGKEAIAGNITTGNIAEFVIYVNMLTWPVASIGWVISIIQRAEASQERINEFLKTKSEITNTSNRYMVINGNIEFKNVFFTYSDSGIQALNNISFKVNSGKTIAFIGKTGSGKTTIANLICRMYNATKGQIKIDGKAINSINLNLLRDSISYIPQESILFSTTISDNIAFGVKGTDQEIIKAAKKSDVHKNIIKFKHKYNTVVGERGITLSGGQKQRIAIARALIKSSKILLFDDCLSAVDTKTEDKILTFLQSEAINKTTVIISHRISTIMFADLIYVLKDGKIIEQGNHHRLLKNHSYYKKLYLQQLTEKKLNV